MLCVISICVSMLDVCDTEVVESFSAIYMNRYRTKGRKEEREMERRDREREIER